MPLVLRFCNPKCACEICVFILLLNPSCCFRGRIECACVGESAQCATLSLKDDTGCSFLKKEGFQNYSGGPWSKK
jgi:hypothetical protein